MNKSTNVLYLTWGESIDLNGLIGNQVFRQLIKISSLRNNLNIFIISGVPYFSKARLHRKKQNAIDYKKIINHLAVYDIDLSIRYIFALPRWFYTKFYLSCFYFVFHISYLRDFIIRNEIEIIHCRSYHAANIALRVRKKYRLNVRIIFDTRGLFPEEGVSKGWYRYNSWSYRMWKKKEQALLKESDMIVNVSENFTNYIKNITENTKVLTIYTSVDIDAFYRDNALRKKFRDKLGFSTDEKVLVYIGSIDISGWHRVDTLISLYKVFRTIFFKTRLLVVTQSIHDPLRDSFHSSGLTNSDYYLFESTCAQQTNNYLNASDFASFPYRKNKTEVDRLISHTVLATKTGEYLSAGLPLLVNKEVGEAAMLIEKYGLGAVYAIEYESDIVDAVLAIEDDYDNVSIKCVEVAKQFFDSTKNAFKYLNIYDQMINRNEIKETE